MIQEAHCLGAAYGLRDAEETLADADGELVLIGPEDRVAVMLQGIR